MQSYRRRFDGQTPEIIEYARTYGRRAAQTKYAPDGDTYCFDKYLEDASQDHNIGLNPQIDGSDGMDMARYIVAALFEKYESLKHQLEDVQKEREAEQAARIEAENRIKMEGLELVRELNENT